jgi:hypothetical protein
MKEVADTDKAVQKDHPTAYKAVELRMELIEMTRLIFIRIPLL